MQNDFAAVFCQQSLACSLDIKLIKILEFNGNRICFHSISTGIQAHALIVELQLQISTCADGSTCGSNNAAVLAEVVNRIICMQYAGKLILFILLPFAGNLACEVIFSLCFRIGYIRSNTAILKAALTSRLVIGDITCLFNNRACS